MKARLPVLNPIRLFRYFPSGEQRSRSGSLDEPIGLQGMEGDGAFAILMFILLICQCDPIAFRIKRIMFLEK